MDERETIGRPPAPPAKPINTWLIIALLAMVGVLVWQNYRDSQPKALHDPDSAPRPVTARGELAEDEKSTIELFRRNSAAVVHITTLSYQRDRRSLDLTEQPRGTGSGFVWDEDGHVVTNFHVIQEANGAKVALADNSLWEARLVGAAPDKDLAVLKIDAPKSRLQPIQIGESHNLLVGQKVFAIGSPFSLDQTLTSGVISGLGREIQSVTNQTIHDVIQTDAAINPGNSGGPLLDSAGRLIGVNTAIYSPSGAYAGIGFAVPVDVVNRVVPQLIRTGKADRPGLGIRILEDSQVKLLIERKVLEKPGVLVNDVLKQGAAAKAGLRGTKIDEEGLPILGDLITSINGKPITSTKELYKILDAHQVGDTIQVEYLREGESRAVEMTLQPLPTMSL